VLPQLANQSSKPRFSTASLSALLLTGLIGCYSTRNGWLDPSVVGTFDHSATLEIRDSLTLEDTPGIIPGASYPWPEDLELFSEEHVISEGDSLAIEIYELRERQIPFQTQIQVSATGTVNLPVVGRVRAAGFTLPEFEQQLASALQEKGVLLNPQITVNPIFLQKATYSIFGIGVSAADNAPLRAGTFPIRRPDMRILEAINLVGGLNEFVSEIFVFRDYVPPARRQTNDEQSRVGPPSTRARTVADRPTAVAQSAVRSSDRGVVLASAQAPPSRKQELLDVVEKDNGPDAEVQPEEEPERPDIEDPAAPLEPDPTRPYLWVNGEFIRNPDYQRPIVDVSEPPPSDGLMYDGPSATVNWARISGDSTYRIIAIPAESLRIGDPEADIFVRPGDVIRIVSGEIGIYYVMGQVNRVGAFNFNAEPVTLKAAIAVAGGLSPLAWPDRCTVYRRVGQREQVIQVDLDRIFAGRDPDFLIRRSDIINVGTHPLAPFLQRVRAWTLPNPINNVGYSFTYARNYADIDSYSSRVNPHNVPDRFPNLFP